MAMAIRHRHGAIEFTNDNGKINTMRDNHSLRINSRNFNNASGDAMSFQAKPSQAVASTGSMFGAQISPRCASGIALDGVLVGLQVNPDQKGTAAGTIGEVRGLAVEITADTDSGRTITNDVSAIWVRSYMPASGGVSGSKQVMKVMKAESGGTAYDAFLKFEDAQAGLITAQTSATTVSHAIKCLIDSTVAYIPLYATVG